MSLHERYHVSDGESFVEATSTRDAAFRAAVRHANRQGVAHTVYDKMARVGAAQLWTIHPGVKEGASLVLPPMSYRANGDA